MAHVASDCIRLAFSRSDKGEIEIHSLQTGTLLILPAADRELLIRTLKTLDLEALQSSDSTATVKLAAHYLGRANRALLEGMPRKPCPDSLSRAKAFVHITDALRVLLGHPEIRNDQG